jgi:nitrite reductase/ring-hydroxylating ferredoxin subunit
MIRLANEKDIPEGGRFVVSLPKGHDIVLFKVEGKIYALDNACPHMGGPLGEGDVEGDIVTCPWHGWQFDIKSGECINVPGDNATCIPLKVIDGEVFLDTK